MLAQQLGTSWLFSALPAPLCLCGSTSRCIRCTWEVALQLTTPRLPSFCLPLLRPSHTLLALPSALTACSTVQFEVDGAPATFDLFFTNSWKTNGGWMYDVVVTFQVWGA